MEIWKDIKGYEGYYQVSSLGRVKSLERLDSKGRLVKERLLSPKKDSQGYVNVCLCKDGNKKYIYIHKLVALAFLPNPKNKETVNHKNEIKNVNCVGNLEWLTMKENANYGTRNIRMVAHKDYSKIAKKLSASAHKKAIIQLKDGKVIRQWDSITDAAKGLGVSLRAIQNVLRKETHKCKGFCFEYVN